MNTLRGAQALNRGKAAPFADAVCQRLEGREEQFIGVVSTLAKAYADCVNQDYQVFMEHFLATDTAS